MSKQYRFENCKRLYSKNFCRKHYNEKHGGGHPVPMVRAIQQQLQQRLAALGVVPRPYDESQRCRWIAEVPLTHRAPGRLP